MARLAKPFRRHQEVCGAHGRYFVPFFALAYLVGKLDLDQLMGHSITLALRAVMPLDIDELVPQHDQVLTAAPVHL